MMQIIHFNKEVEQKMGMKLFLFIQVNSVVRQWLHSLLQCKRMGCGFIPIGNTRIKPKKIHLLLQILVINSQPF